VEEGRSPNRYPTRTKPTRPQLLDLTVQTNQNQKMLSRGPLDDKLASSKLHRMSAGRRPDKSPETNPFPLALFVFGGLGALEEGDSGS
jgi:hypothetical protein